ncbi:uncharacterized [Tachysurus ichikawai]
MGVLDPYQVGGPGKRIFGTEEAKPSLKLKDVEHDLGYLGKLFRLLCEVVWGELSEAECGEDKRKGNSTNKS